MTVKRFPVKKQTTSSDSNAPAGCACNASFVSSLERTAVIHSKGLLSLSCDKKDIFLNRLNLEKSLEDIDVPQLISASPVILNFSCDGLPRINGQTFPPAQDPQTYDPNDPSMWPTFAFDGAKVPLLGYHVTMRPFDTDMGASTIRVLLETSAGDKVVDVLYELGGGSAEFVVPAVRPVNSITAVPGDIDNEIVTYDITETPRVDSYEVGVFTSAAGAPAGKVRLMGVNCYLYIVPVLASGERVAHLKGWLHNGDSDCYACCLAEAATIC